MIEGLEEEAENRAMCPTCRESLLKESSPERPTTAPTKRR